MSGDLHVFTARMDEDEYEVLRSFAFVTKVSINEVVVKAVRTYMRQHATETELARMVKRRQEDFRRFRERTSED